MKTGRFFNRWTFLAAILVVIIIAGGVIIGSKYRPVHPVEISLNPAPAPQGDIYIGGEVHNPGIYPFSPRDSLDDILRAAGGVTGDADLSHVALSVPAKGQVAEVQKVNINTADAWLLAALPGIGDTRAQAIIAYRLKNGPFRDINELLNIEGLGTVTLEKIRDLITVGD